VNHEKYHVVGQGDLMRQGILEMLDDNRWVLENDV
jgi:hypothetical protein